MEPDDRRRRLLDGARRVFARHAFHDVSIEMLAEAARSSKGLIHHYFGGKRGLYLAYLREQGDRLLHTVVTDSQEPTLHALRRAIGRYLDYVEENPVEYVALLEGGLGQDVDVADIVRSARDATIRHILSLNAPSGATAAQETAVRGWLGCVEAATLYWLRTHALARAELEHFLVAALPALLTLRR